MTFPLAFWILLATAAVGVFLLVYEYRHRRIEREFHSFPRTVLALLTWILAYAAELALTNPDQMLFAANIQFIGIGSVPYLLYLTVRQFLGRPLKQQGVTAFAIVVTAVTIVLAFTDSRWGLLRDDAALVHNLGMAQLQVRYGIWHNFVFVPYQYGFYLATLVMLAEATVQASRLFRPRLVLFAIGIILPMAGGLLYVLDVSPFEAFNPVPVLIMGSFGLFAVIMVHHRAMDIVPIAREQVMDTIEEGVIVIDLDDHIVEYNLAASAMFWSLNPSAYGREIGDVLGNLDAVMMLARGIEVSDAGFTLSPPGAEERQCLGQGTPLIGFDGRRIGRVITVTDITMRIPRPEADSDSDSDSGEPDRSGKESRSSRDFYKGFAAERSRALAHGHPLYLFAIALPDQGQDADIAGAADIINSQLNAWEVSCYLGSGRFLVSIPDLDRDEILLKARHLARHLVQNRVGAKIGIAALISDLTESAEEMAARALNAVAASKQGIAFAKNSAMRRDIIL